VIAVDVADAQHSLEALIDRTLAGDEVVICRNGKPVARVVAVDAEADRVPGSARGLFVVPEDFDAPLPDFEGNE
jgi:prevent-host-death family protein